MLFVRTVNQKDHVSGGNGAADGSPVRAAAWKSKGNVVSLFATPGVPSPHDVAASQAAASGRMSPVYGHIVIAEGDLQQLVRAYGLKLHASPAQIEIPGGCSL